MADDDRDPPRRRGRPRAESPISSSVTAWLHPADHDRLIALAQRQEKSVSAVVRELLQFKLRRG